MSVQGPSWWHCLSIQILQLVWWVRLLHVTGTALDSVGIEVLIRRRMQILSILWANCRSKGPRIWQCPVGLFLDIWVSAWGHAALCQSRRWNPQICFVSWWWSQGKPPFQVISWYILWFIFLYFCEVGWPSHVVSGQLCLLGLRLRLRQAGSQTINGAWCLTILTLKFSGEFWGSFWAVVKLPGPGPFSLSISAVSLAGGPVSLSLFSWEGLRWNEVHWISAQAQTRRRGWFDGAILQLRKH